jgi:hypothetical protein
MNSREKRQSTCSMDMFKVLLFSKDIYLHTSIIQGNVRLHLKIAPSQSRELASRVIKVI